MARQQRVVPKQQHHQQQQQQQLLKTNFKTVQENVESKNWPLEEFTAKSEKEKGKRKTLFLFKRKNDEDIVC